MGKTHHRRQGSRPLRKRSLGQIPGALIQHPDARRPETTLIAYNEEKFIEMPLDSVSMARQLGKQFDVVWINIDGLGDVGFLESIGKEFGLHALSLEDALNTHQRPKIEDFDNYLYVVLRMAISDTQHVATEQVSVFLVDNFVITMQELPGDCLEPLRDRIRKNKGRVRTRKADYLLYSIIDGVVDGYFPVIDQIGERLDRTEEKIITGAAPIQIHEIHQIRSEVLYLHRVVRPHRDMINEAIREESSFLSAETQTFLRDCFDHLLHLNELTESYRETCSDLRDFQLSKVANKTNDVMKTLTIIATIFIPLSFIVGLYGMNFDNMPELHWHYGYYAALSLMASVAFGLVYWFWRRGWFDPT